MSFKRCFHGLVAAFAVGVLSSFLAITPAHAVGETPTVDGDLTDLIAAVTANLGSDQGGFSFTDPPSDVFTGTCAYINGYDIVKSYAYFRFKNGSGAYTPNDVTLYLGWEVTGIIGDVDGDGNADTFDSQGPGTGCALSDGGGNTGCASGIGVGESYSILLNLNCSGSDDLRLGVSNNKVGILTAGGDLSTEIAGGVFCRNGHFLEVSIPHYEQLLQAPALQAIGATLCQANLRMVANAGDDLLAEDTTPVQQLRIPGSITITKTPASQDACPGTNVSWAIQVCNDGICPFSTVTVSDTLDAGLTYVSDDKGSVQGPNAQIRVWTFSNVNPGDCITINLTSKVDFPCAAAVLNNNVGVEAVEPASPCSQLAEAASAHARAVVNCTQPKVDIGKQIGDPTIAPGEKTTVTLTITNSGDSVLDPINVCDKIDAGVSFDAAQAIGGTCGVSVDSNTLNGDGTRTICFSAFSLAKGASCTITYQVGCVTSGVHPDTATVVAYCKGEGENPVSDRDQASFTCSCPADVEIGKSVTPPNVNPGQDVTVTLTISNPGSTVLDPINVCDKLDAGVSFDAAQTIGGTCGVTLSSNTLNGDGTRTLCFTPFSLNPSGSCTITYKVRCVTSGVHPDTATVIGQCKGGGESDRDQDQDQSSFTCACPPDVEIGKQVSPGNVKSGEPVTVTLTISNPGTTVLDPINVCDKLDAGVGFDAAQTIGGSCGVTLASNNLNGDGSRTICFTPFSLNPGAACTITYTVTCVNEGTHPDTATVTAKCKDGGEQDVDHAQATASFTCANPSCCWLTMGGFLNANSRQGHKDNTYGGNVGPPPSGSWEHIQRDGKTILFNFHSHDAHVISCGNDGNAGPCHPKGDANFINFGGTGFYNFGTGSRDEAATFTARAEDHGEPGRQGTQSGGCGTPDYYTITVRNAATNEVVFTASGYVDGGNIQIHDCKHADKVSAPVRAGGKDLSSTGGSTGVDAGGVEAESQAAPLELYRPQPNPFQNSTEIAYAVGGAGQDVQIGIYNVAGRLIRNLASGFQAAGRYTVSWDGRSTDGSTVPGGVYFLRAYVGGQRMSAAASRILYLR